MVPPISQPLRVVARQGKGWEGKGHTERLRTVERDGGKMGRGGVARVATAPAQPEPGGSGGEGK